MADNTPIETPRESVSAQVHRDLRQKYDSTRRRLATLVEDNRQLRADLDTAARNNRRMVEILNLTRDEITTLKDSIADNAQPPFSFGTVLEVHAGREHDPEIELPAVARPSADILYSGRKMRTHISPLLNPEAVTSGSEVLLDEGLSIVAVLGASPTGETGRVKELLDEHRLVVMGRSDDEHVVKRAGALQDQRIRVGDAVLVDYRSGYATQVLDISDVQDVMLEEVPDATFEDIGGLGGADRTDPRFRGTAISASRVIQRTQPATAQRHFALWPTGHRENADRQGRSAITCRASRWSSTLLLPQHQGTRTAQ